MSIGLKKILSKAAAAGAALVMSAGLVPAGTSFITAHADGEVVVRSWTDLNTALNVNGSVSIKLGGNLTAGGSDKPLRVRGYTTAVLDLAGYTLNRNMTSAATNGQAIINNGILTIKDSSSGQTGKITGAYHKEAGAVNNSGTLTIEGGTITGNTAGSPGGRAYGAGINNDGVLYIKGGTISGNKAVSGGGGIFNDEGTIYMSGGTITGNEAGAGAGIYNQNVVYLSGGTITNNAATGYIVNSTYYYGAGLFGIEGSSVYISGNPTVTGNIGNGAASNVDTAMLNLNGKLTGGKIGYSRKTEGVFTNGWKTYMSSYSPSDYFTSDNASFSVKLSSGEAALGTGGSGEVTQYVTVTFDNNGGNGTMSPENIVKDSEYELPPCTFTAPAGQTFDKWDQGAAGSKITVSRNITLKALWKSATTNYTVSYEYNGGSGTLPASSSVAAGSKYTLPSTCSITPPANKAFDKWNLGAAGTQITINSNTVVKPVWKDAAVYYTVSYEYNGGSGNLPLDDTVAAGSKYTLPATCTITPPANKTFDKWNLGAAGAQITINSNTVVKPVWKDATVYYTVSYEYNGGSGTLPQNASVASGSKYTLPATCTITPPANKTFDKWNLGAAGDKITITANTVIKPIWKDASQSTNIKGDVNNDGKVNLKDYVALQRYLNKWGNEINFNNADVIADGRLNVKDLVQIRRYLNKIITSF